MNDSQQLLESLTQLLKTHDWGYQFSDDHRVWRAGEQHSLKIQHAMDKLFRMGLEQEARALYNEHRRG